MNINKKSVTNKTGYTLVEILVVMVISFIIFGGVYKALTTENTDLNDEQLMLDAQLNARAALEVVADDIRKAAFLGCGGDSMANTVVNAGVNDPLQSLITAGTTDILPALTATASIDYLGAPLAYINNNDSSIIPSYKDGTDVLALRFLSGDVPLNGAMANTNTNPITLKTNTFKEGDILYITDCEDYSVFQKTNCDNTQSIVYGSGDGCGTAGDSPPYNVATPDLGKEYQLKARVYKLVINTYFIATGSFTLYRNQTGATGSIFDNIEDLQFQYKEDTDNDNDLSDQAWSDTFTSAEAVGAIKIYILARSDQIFSYTNNNLYNYPNSPYTAAPGPNDHRYRYLAAAEVGLRNFAE